MHQQFVTATVEARARASRGTSERAIYHLVAQTVRSCGHGQGVLADVGCGTGNLWGELKTDFEYYLGVDAVRYEGFPEDAEFFLTDLNTTPWPVPSHRADVVVAVETIEHLENPRAFMRELVRIARPGGWVIVTTPNQLSFLSKLTLVCKNCFNAFQQGSYPAHITALLEVDLRRIATECGLEEMAIAFTCSGRIVGTPWHYPRWWAKLRPRSFSDNILLVGKTPRQSLGVDS